MEAEGTFLIIFGAHMNILFVIKAKFLVLVQWLYRSSQVMLTIEPGMDVMFWAHVFLVSVLKATPNHIPLKYRCPNKESNRRREVTE